MVKENVFKKVKLKCKEVADFTVAQQEATYRRADLNDNISQLLFVCSVIYESFLPKLIETV